MQRRKLVYAYRIVFIAIRRVLHLKMVTQCAMLEDFGIFLVLADKVGVNLRLGYYLV